MENQYFWMFFILALLVGFIVGINTATVITTKAVAENKYLLMENYGKNLAREVKYGLITEQQALEMIKAFATAVEPKNYGVLMEYSISAFYGELYNIPPLTEIEAVPSITGHAIPPSTEIEAIPPSTEIE